MIVNCFVRNCDGIAKITHKVGQTRFDFCDKHADEARTILDKVSDKMIAMQREAILEMRSIGESE